MYITLIVPVIKHKRSLSAASLCALSGALLLSLSTIGCEEAAAPVAPTEPVPLFPLTCPNGTPQDGSATAENTEQCASCADGYVLQGATCAPIPMFPYACQNGSPRDGSVTADNTEQCAMCAPGFVPEGASCARDSDNDAVADVFDIDDDNDGLIEIATLEQLHNIRYNLAGTSYDTDEDDSTPSVSAPNAPNAPNSGGSGITTGAPTTSTLDCPIPIPIPTPSNANAQAAPPVYLCGYELVADLDFDTNGDGTWSATGASASAPATYTLDENDHNALYFPIDTAGAGGWQPIATRSAADAATTPSTPGNFDTSDTFDTFDAIFDGNNRSIANLAIQRGDIYLGLFGALGNGAQIRNVVLRNALVSYNGASENSGKVGAGALVGFAERSALTANYANAVTGRAPGAIGGLFGRISYSPIVGNRTIDATLYSIASTNNHIGGIVGGTTGSSMHNNYAINIALHGDTARDYMGGLVGEFTSARGISPIISNSYARNITAIGGAGGDHIGGVLGESNVFNDVALRIENVHAQNVTLMGGANGDTLGGVAGRADGPVVASYAINAALSGGAGINTVGGLAGLAGGDIVTSHVINTGVTIDGGGGTRVRVGGIAGATNATVNIIASYFIGNATPTNPISIKGGTGLNALVGGIVGETIAPMILGCYVAGDGRIDGGTGDSSNVGGLIGLADERVTMRHNYVTAPITDSGGSDDLLGGFIGLFEGGVLTIAANYVTSDVTDMSGGSTVGALWGSRPGTTFAAFTATYGFGTASGVGTNVNTNTDTRSTDASAPASVGSARDLTAENSSTITANRWSDKIWDFGDTDNPHAPRLYYAHYNLGVENGLNVCNRIPRFVPRTAEPVNCIAPSTLIPNQP